MGTKINQTWEFVVAIFQKITMEIWSTVRTSHAAKWWTKIHLSLSSSCRYIFKWFSL